MHGIYLRILLDRIRFQSTRRVFSRVKADLKPALPGAEAKFLWKWRCLICFKMFLQRIVYPKPWDPKCTKRRVGVCFEESLRNTDISVFKMQTDRAMLVIFVPSCALQVQGQMKGASPRACVNGHVAAAKSSSEGPSRPTIASTFITSNLFRQRCQCWVTHIR